uniref:Uncharacterized protein n=1 Tax=Arundo donax TaxID=35708 RepID=A0A0A9DM84_ARUDO
MSEFLTENLYIPCPKLTSSSVCLARIHLPIIDCEGRKQSCNLEEILYKGT